MCLLSNPGRNRISFLLGFLRHHLDVVRCWHPSGETTMTFALLGSYAL